jgi:hypothetical protein
MLTKRRDLTLWSGNYPPEVHAHSTGCFAEYKAGLAQPHFSTILKYD